MRKDMGYIRTSTDKQELDKPPCLLLEHARKQQLRTGEIWAGLDNVLIAVNPGWRSRSYSTNPVGVWGATVRKIRLAHTLGESPGGSESNFPGDIHPDTGSKVGINQVQKISK